MRSKRGVRFIALIAALFFVIAPCAAATQAPSKTVTVTTNENVGGLFVVDGKIGNVDVKFVIDTGASGVAISQETDIKLGLKEDDAIGYILMSTANGPARASLFFLPTVTIGDITVRSLITAVLPAGADMNLLGMSFIMKLKRLEIRKNTLILEQ